MDFHVHVCEDDYETINFKDKCFWELRKEVQKLQNYIIISGEGTMLHLVDLLVSRYKISVRIPASKKRFFPKGQNTHSAIEWAIWIFCCNARLTFKNRASYI